MARDEDIRKNASGYSDPTAYQAIKNVDGEDEKFHKLLDTIFNLCELSGFHLEERIVLKDKNTGKVYSKRQIITRSDIKLLQLFASWSNSL